MPTNLPTEYYNAEKRYKEADTPTEKVRCLEELISAIPKHKGTDHLRADLRRKLSKMKEAAQTKKKTGKQESPYQIDWEGAGRVVLLGMANVGKSSVLTTLTNATPKVDAAPFTTWGPTPGMMPIENIQVQLIDTPPLSRDHIEPEMKDLIRNADLVMILLDLQAFPIQQLEDSLAILKGHRIEICCRDNEETETGRPPIVPMIIVSKHDDASQDEDFEVFCELFADEWSFLSISTETGRNIDQFKQKIFDTLEIIRIYSKPPGKEPNMDAPFVMKKGGTVEDFARKIHKELADSLKTARVWGSGQFDGQQVSRDYVLHDEDVVELVV
ncbi:TGS domain-containing protein [bacterium]|nr:TGS domain-containing protein [bacterium]